MDFRSLLDKPLLYEFSILDVLFQHDSWVTINEIAAETGFNRKTIIKYLALIDEYPELSGLIRKKGAGIQLKMSRIDYTKIKTSILKRSVPFAMIDKILKNGSFSMSDISKETYLSESNIYRYMRKLKKILNSYNIDLVKKRNQYRLIGDERTIRFYLYLFYWQVYKGVSWPFSEGLRKKVAEDLQIVAQNAGMYLAVPFENQLTLIVSINYLRYRTRCFIHREDAFEQLYALNETIPAFNQLNLLFTTNYHMSKDETHLFFFYLLTRPSFYHSWDYADHFIENHQHDKTEIAKASERAAKEMKKQFPLLHIKTDADSSFFKSLFSIHYHTMLFKEFPTDISNYKLTPYIDRNFPQLKKEIVTVSQHLTTTDKNPCFEQEDYLITHYSILLANILSETHFEKKIYLKMETDFPFFIERIVKNQLLNHFKNTYHLIFTENEQEYFDLLLTVPGSHVLEQSIAKEKIIYITPELTIQTYKTISRKLRTLIQK